MSIFGSDATPSVGGVSVDTVAQVVSQFAIDPITSTGRTVAITTGNTTDGLGNVIAVAGASFTIPAGTKQFICLTALNTLVMEAVVSVGNQALWELTAGTSTIIMAVDLRYNFSGIPTVAAFLTKGGMDYFTLPITTAAATAQASVVAAAASAAAALASEAAAAGHVVTAAASASAAATSAADATTLISMMTNVAFGDLGSLIHAATAKVVPISTDELLLLDSAVAGFPSKKITYGNLRSAILSGDLGTIAVTDLAIGDQGTEGTGINIAGITYQSSMKVSDINGSHYAQSILHRHSTVLAPVLVAARSNSDTSAHVNVALGQDLFLIYGAGTAGTNYKLFGGIAIGVDVTGTVSDTSAPGRMTFLVSADGTTVPVPWLSTDNKGQATFANNVTAQGNSDARSFSIAAISAALPAITILDSCLHLARDDSDKGAWRKRKGQSWRSETIYTGRQYGSYASATAAYAAGLRGTGTTADIYYQTGGTAGWYAMTGVNTSVIIYRAGREDYPTNAMITVEAARVVIWDLDGASPTMWMVFVASGTNNNIISGTCSRVAALNNHVVLTLGSGVADLDFISDSAYARRVATTAVYYCGAYKGTLAQRNSTAGWMSNAVSAIVNDTVNAVALVVLPDAPYNEFGLPIPVIAAATAGGVSEIQTDGTVKNSALATAAYGVSYDSIGRIRWNTTTEYNCSPVAPRSAAFTASSATEPKISSAAYSTSNIPTGLVIASTTGKSTTNAIASTNGLTLYRAGQSSAALFADITSVFNTGWQVGDSRAAFYCNSLTADRSINALTLVTVGAVAGTVNAGGRNVYSGFSTGNYSQIASNAAFNALGTGDFSIIMGAVKWGTAGTSRTYLSIGDGVSAGSCLLWQSGSGGGNNLGFYIHNGVAFIAQAVTTSGLTDTAEHTLQIVRRGGILYIIIDGVAVASGASILTISNATGFLRIGLGQDATYSLAAWTGGQCACVRISATAPTLEQSRFIAQTENALNGGQTCLLSNSSSVANVVYNKRSRTLSVVNGTNTDCFSWLKRIGAETTATGAVISGIVPDGPRLLSSGTSNIFKWAARNVSAELLETAADVAPREVQYLFTTPAATTTQALPQGWKARGIAFNTTDSTFLGTYTQTFDGFIWTLGGLTASKAYQINIVEDK